jgi:Asp-tRNA(Asn)/Glu-tRNA(Gln) amidotransferase C subunit
LRNWLTITIKIQLISVDVNLCAEATAVWPMRGRTRKDQSTNTKQENIQ